MSDREAAHMDWVRHAPVIDSARNPRVRAAAALRDRRERERTGRTLVDGIRELERALDAGLGIVEVFLATDAPEHVRTAAGRCAAQGTPVIPVGSPAFGRLAYGERQDGIVAVVEIPDRSLAALRLPEHPLVVVLDGVEKPGNVGATLRSTDAAGADALLAANPGTDVFNPNVIRASLGTVFTVPIAVADGPAVREWLRARRIRMVAARVEAQRLHIDTDLTGAVAIVLGSEAEGLDASWDEPDIHSVRLPMLGAADSLNVSVAAAILLYEARRQRGLPAQRVVPHTGEPPATG
jgi:RNA methyltransferase, TrmH family